MCVSGGALSRALWTHTTISNEKKKTPIMKYASTDISWIMKFHVYLFIHLFIALRHFPKFSFQNDFMYINFIIRKAIQFPKRWWLVYIQSFLLAKLLLHPSCFRSILYSHRLSSLLFKARASFLLVLHFSSLTWWLPFWGQEGSLETVAGVYSTGIYRPRAPTCVLWGEWFTAGNAPAVTPSSVRGGTWGYRW